METNVNYTLVGTFVLALIAFTILGIIWLSSGFSTEEYSIYKVYMKESVSGLTLDSPVEFNGVDVGNIEKVRINRKNPQLVELLLKVKSSTPVTEGTVAMLSMRGITGITFIALQDKGLNKNPLRAAKGHRYPVIKTVPSIFVRLDTILTKLSDSFQQMSTSIHSLLSNENLQSIKLILHSSQNTLELLEKQTIPSANQTAQNLENITRDLSRVSSDVKRNPSILIRGKAPAPLGPGE